MTSTDNLKKHQKLCHIVKIKDFDGYGFNLHSEKNKPGQYIGRVDSNSPAEAAGLKEGDRIIQVNGVDIGAETHRQVVQRIKAIQREVLLLVIDPKDELTETDDSIKINETKLHTSELNVLVTNKYDTDDHSNQNENSSEKNDEILIRSQNNKENSTKIERNSIKNENGTSENVDVVKTDNTVKNTSPLPLESKKNYNTDVDNCSNQNNGKNLDTKYPESLETNPKINLKMTASELRAKLLSKKKYDPKNDTLDFHKKYNIIEEL